MPITLLGAVKKTLLVKSILSKSDDLFNYFIVLL